MAATKLITHTASHIVIVDTESPQESKAIPKKTCTILRRIAQNSETDYVLLNWPSGVKVGQVWKVDSAKIRYSEVISPSVATNAALYTLLKGYAETADNANAIQVSYWGVDIIDDAVSHGGSWKSIQVLAASTFGTLTDNGDKPSTGLIGYAFPAGSFFSANGRFTSIKKTGAGVIICIRGGPYEGFTTSSTTSTTSTTTT